MTEHAKVATSQTNQFTAIYLYSRNYVYSTTGKLYVS